MTNCTYDKRSYDRGYRHGVDGEIYDPPTTWGNNKKTNYWAGYTDGWNDKVDEKRGQNAS